jgi:hypothetical protein
VPLGNQVLATTLQPNHPANETNAKAKNKGAI